MSGANETAESKRKSTKPEEARQRVATGPAKRPGQKKTKAGKVKPNEKLMCRYCGSDDLSPSFIKRRDRRCRKCFSKRYGSTARSKRVKGRKK